MKNYDLKGYYYDMKKAPHLHSVTKQALLRTFSHKAPAVKNRTLYKNLMIFFWLAGINLNVIIALALNRD